ncbi:hypothetical protein DIPPA_06759 [Diplonema papillatum]|nr:hypothetical protein DIPPA_06759 [Diplonema papillatum]
MPIVDHVDDSAVGAERAASPKNRKNLNDLNDDDALSVGSGFDGEGAGQTFEFGMAGFSGHDDDEQKHQTPASGIKTPPPFSPGDRRAEDRFAQSWPPRTPGKSACLKDSEQSQPQPQQQQQQDAAFTLDPGGAAAGAGLPPPHPNTGGYPPSAAITRIPSVRKPKQASTTAAQTDAVPERYGAVESSDTTIGNPGETFCTILLNGMQTIQCQVPIGERSTRCSVELKPEIFLYGENSGMFLQIMFYSPNFPVNPEFHVHGSFELLDKDDQVLASLYLGLLEEASQVEKKQHTVTGVPCRGRVVLDSISPFSCNPNEAHLVEEICDVLRNSRINPGRGSLPSVLVQHRAKESPLYEKVVGKHFQSSWHTFMKAHDNVFTLFHYSQKEIQERRLGPFAKFNEARIVLKEHERGDWKSADEMAALRHAQAEEGLKGYLIKLLELRDYDQRELLEVLHGNTHFNHFLSPTFSILMRTLCRHKGTFITSNDPDQPTRIGLARPDQTAIEQMSDQNAGQKQSMNGSFGTANSANPAGTGHRGAFQQADGHSHSKQPLGGQLLQLSPLDQQQQQQQQHQHQRQQQQQQQQYVLDNNAQQFARFKLGKGGDADPVNNLMHELIENKGRNDAFFNGGKFQAGGAPHQQVNGHHMWDANSAVNGQQQDRNEQAPQNRQLNGVSQQQFVLDGRFQNHHHHHQQQQQHQQQQPMAQLSQNLQQGFSMESPQTMVVLKQGHQQQQQSQHVQHGQQVLLVNQQPTSSDGNWVVTHQPQNQMAPNFVIQGTPPNGPSGSEHLYPALSTPPMQPSGSNSATPTESCLQPSYYQQGNVLLSSY